MKMQIVSLFRRALFGCLGMSCLMNYKFYIFISRLRKRHETFLYICKQLVDNLCVQINFGVINAAGAFLSQVVQLSKRKAA